MLFVMCVIDNNTFIVQLLTIASVLCVCVIDNNIFIVQLLTIATQQVFCVCVYCFRK